MTDNLTVFAEDNTLLSLHAQSLLGCSLPGVVPGQKLVAEE